MDWALATRFQADKDLEVETGFRALPLDPSLGGASTWAKAGFDLTLPFGQSRGIEFQLSEAPVFGAKRGETVEDALAEGPMHFGAIMGPWDAETGARWCWRSMRCAKPRDCRGSRTAATRFWAAIPDSALSAQRPDPL